MFSLRNIRSGKAEATPDQALQKLKRQDLLELLLEQMRANDELRTQLGEDERYATGLEALVGRLKGKLDEKDSQIDTLRARLDQKDSLIEALHEAGRAIAYGERRGERLAALVAFEDLLVEANWGRYAQEETAEDSDDTTEPAEDNAAADAQTADAQPADSAAAPADDADAEAAEAQTAADATPQHFATFTTSPEEVA